MLRVAILTWLAIVAVTDLRTGAVNNLLTIPVILLGTAIRVAQADPWRWSIMLLAWILFILMWDHHVIGGGSAKFNMAMHSLFASPEFLLLQGGVAFGLFGIILLYLVLKEGYRPGWPDAARLNTHGRRLEWVWAICGGLYVLAYL